MAFLAPNKTIKVASGNTYSYIHYPPSSHSKPTLLFLHGFPCTSYEWRNQISYFVLRRYGVLAPDLLGYGGSSKPTSPSSYLGSIMAADIISILDHESITEPVVGIAHDWGTYVLSQLATYFSARFQKFAFVSVPFRQPGSMMDVHAVNKATEKELGYPMCEYWLFFTENGAGKLCGDHWESFFDAVYSSDAQAWKTSLGLPGGLKNFISSDQKLELPPFLTAADKAHHHADFGNDYSVPLLWYHRGIRNLGVPEEKRLLENGEISKMLGKDTLFVAGLKDAICPASKGKAAMAAAVEASKLKVANIEAGHWIMLEKPDELNRTLEEFVARGGKGRNESSL